jgi:hypothetical protein
MKQFLHKMWSFQLAFLFLVRMVFLSSLTPYNISLTHTTDPTDLHPSPAAHFKTYGSMVRNRHHLHGTVCWKDTDDLHT